MNVHSAPSHLSAGDWDPNLYRKFENERMLASRSPRLRFSILGAHRLRSRLRTWEQRRTTHSPLFGVEGHGLRHVGRNARSGAGARSGSPVRQAGHSGLGPEEQPDLIFANAAMQFRPEHHRLFPRLAALQAPGIAFSALWHHSIAWSYCASSMWRKQR